MFNLLLIEVNLFIIGIQENEFKTAKSGCYSKITLLS